MKKLFGFFLLFFIVSNIAQAQFEISAQLRPRAEMDNGTFTPRNDSTATAYYISQRSRIKLNYNTDKFEMRFSLQDVRVWGNGNIYTSTGVFASTHSVDIYEAWFKIKFGSSTNLVIGRQELKYDDQRLISWRNWSQFGLTYDALVFNHKKKDWEINVGLSYNNMINENNGKPMYGGELFNSNNLMKSFNFVRVNKKFSEKLSATFIATGAGYQKANNPDVLYMMGTFGLWAKYKTGGFEAKANAYYQMGKAQSGKEVSAYMFTINPSYRTGAFKFGVGLDYLSGDDASGSDYLSKVKTFNKMYGAVFAYYGNMNYYSYMPGSTKNGGLVDIYPNVEFTFEKKHVLRGYYHFFSLANQIMLNATLVEDQDLGQEFDLMYIYKYSKELTLQAGLSYYFTTETLERAKGVEVGNVSSPYWAWLMLTFKPTLFTSKK